MSDERSEHENASRARTERDRRLRARRGLAIYFAVLVPLSAVLETRMILGDGSSWVVSALMWTPGAASIVARLILREGFADVSFRLGGRRGVKAVGIALLFPIVIGLISYGIAWTVGLVHFTPQPDTFSARFVGDSTPPMLVFVINLALAATVVAVFSRPRRRRRRDRLARVHAHAADRCRRAEACPGERRDLGSVARAAHPGRGLPGRSAANGLGSPLDGRSRSNELRARTAAAGDGQYLAGDHAARGLEQHHSGCVRSGEHRPWCDAVGRRVGNSRRAHHDCGGGCLHARPLDGPQIARSSRDMTLRQPAAPRA